MRYFLFGLICGIPLGVVVLTLVIFESRRAQAEYRIHLVSFTPKVPARQKEQETER